MRYVGVAGHDRGLVHPTQLSLRMNITTSLNTKLGGETRSYIHFSRIGGLDALEPYRDQLLQHRVYVACNSG